MNALSVKMLTLKDQEDASPAHWWGSYPHGPNAYGGAMAAMDALLGLLEASTELDPAAQVPLVRYLHALMPQGSDERVAAWGHALRLGVSPNLSVPYGSGFEQYAGPSGPAYFRAGSLAEFELFLEAGANLKAVDDFQDGYAAKVSRGNHNPEHQLSYSVDLRPRLVAFYQNTGMTPPPPGVRTAPLRYRSRR